MKNTEPLTEAETRDQLDSRALSNTLPRNVAPVCARARPPRQLWLSRAGGAILRTGEQIYVVLALFIFSGALLPLLFGASQLSEEPGDTHPLVSGIFRLIVVLLIILIFLRPRSFVSAALRHKPTLLLATVAVLSAAWSVAVPETVSSAAGLVITTAFGLYLSSRFRASELLMLLGCALGAVALLSFMLAVPPLSSSFSFAHPGGEWHGVFTHKNTLGRMMALGTAVFLVLALSLSRRRWIAWLGCGACIVLVLLSQSTTALASVLTSLALFPMFSTLRWRSTRMIPLLIGAVLALGIAAMIVLVNTEAVFALVGKDATLTGRTGLWSAVLERIRYRPWLGYGLGAFWLGWDGESGAVWSAIGWRAPDAHNGFLELWLGLGFAGLAIFVWSFALVTTRAVATLQAVRTAESIWPLMLLTFIALSNLTESAVLARVDWILYVATASSVLLRQGRRDGVEESMNSSLLGGIELPNSENRQHRPLVGYPSTPALRRHEVRR